MSLIHTPRGTRDFRAEQLRKRQYILELLRGVFESYAYEPLETPAMELKQNLMGKYGDEEDKLIFKIVDNGDISKKVPPNTELEQIPNLITEKALRYDLTIPMARFVSMHNNSIPLPFKRYQMQAVWRGDKPQKGRYREFYQCDIDIVGSDSLLCEAELLGIYAQVFHKLGIPQLEIQINSRKILKAIIEQIKAKEYSSQIIASIDKIEKIGKLEVINLCRNYLSEPAQLDTLLDFLSIEGDNSLVLDKLRTLFVDNSLGLQGLAELAEILDLLAIMQVPYHPMVTLNLARGIDYYTGMIVEVKTKAVSMGSLGGGGRYQNIADSFGVAGINGVGISFGVDRIYDVLEELKLFPALETKPKLLFAYMDINAVAINLKLANKLRQASFICMLFPEAKKITKQIKYAEKKNIPYIVFIGEQELTENKATIKNIQTGRQNSISLDAGITEWQDCLNKL